MATPRPARSTRLIVGALALALLLVGAAGVVLLRTTGVGAGGLRGASNRLEDWIGLQIVGVANSYLVPQLAFDTLDYRAPGTVALRGATFTAPDGTRVFEIEEMTIALAETPRIGQPILIERITLDRPVVNLIRELSADGSPGLKGLHDVVRASPTSDADVESNFRLSNVLRLRRVEIQNGSLVYDPGAGSEKMVFSGLTAGMDATAEADEPGWYAIKIDCAAGPLAALTLDGALSLDSYDAKVRGCRLIGMLSPESSQALPPEVQRFVSRLDARGDLDLTVSGAFALADPMAGSMRFALRMQDLRIASEELKLEVPSLEAESTLANGIATLNSMHAELLSGTMDSFGDIELTEPGRPARCSWTLTDLDLREMVRSTSASDEPIKLAGRLTGNGSATTELGRARERLGGSGELHLRNGRLLILPGVEQLAQFMSIATARMLDGEPKTNADASLQLRPEGVEFSDISIRSGVVAVRGKGLIGFDGSLDFALNGGPMERVQSLLGVFGDAMGAVTDRLVKYRVRGTLSAPEVSVDPLGLQG